MTLSKRLAAAMAALLGRPPARAGAPAVERVVDAPATPPRQSERERLYTAVVESSEDAIVTKTLDGIVTAWNPAAERMFGYPPHEMIGKSIETIVPDDRREELRALLARLKRGEHIQPFETVRLRRDGRRIDVSLSVSPVKSETGEIIGAAKIARDITNRRKAQNDLMREIEERR